MKNAYWLAAVPVVVGTSVAAGYWYEKRQDAKNVIPAPQVKATKEESKPVHTKTPETQPIPPVSPIPVFNEIQDFIRNKSGTDFLESAKFHSSMEYLKTEGIFCVPVAVENWSITTFKEICQLIHKRNEELKEKISKKTSRLYHQLKIFGSTGKAYNYEDPHTNRYMGSIRLRASDADKIRHDVNASSQKYVEQATQFAEDDYFQAMCLLIVLAEELKTIEAGIPQVSIEDLATSRYGDKFKRIHNPNKVKKQN